MRAGRTMVLGGASLIGRFLLPRLAAERPLAISRRPPIGNADAEWIAGDLLDPVLISALPLLGLVLSLSPIWLLPEALPALIEKGARRVVAFSSTSRFTKATSPVPAERAVAERLAESEARVIALCEAEGVTWTILRPTLIYAEGLDGNVSRLAGLIRRFGVLPLAGRGEGLRQPVHADDLAAACLAVVASEAARNRAYDLPGGRDPDLSRHGRAGVQRARPNAAHRCRACADLGPRFCARQAVAPRRDGGDGLADERGLDLRRKSRAAGLRLGAAAIPPHLSERRLTTARTH